MRTLELKAGWFALDDIETDMVWSDGNRNLPEGLQLEMAATIVQELTTQFDLTTEEVVDAQMVMANILT
jgi:hypothetical protein